MDNAHNRGNPIIASGIPLTKAAYANNQFRQASGMEGILTGIFRSICKETSPNKQGISPIQWNRLMADYLRNLPENQSGYDRMSVRGNLNKEFRRAKMTWLVFCKGMRFLKFLCFNIRIQAVTEDNVEFDANTSFLLSTMAKLKETISEGAIEEFFPKNSKFPPNALGIHYGNAQKPKFVNGPKGVLARLFNIICLEYSGGTGIGHLQWNKLLTNFIEKYGDMYKTADSMSIRGNLKKEFRKGSMTWKVLCKGLRFLKVSTFIVTIRGIREDGSEYETSVQYYPPRSKEVILGGEEE